jgi:hypothetical protein
MGGARRTRQRDTGDPPTPNAKPSSWRASGRGSFAPMCRASSAPRVTKVERPEHLVASHTKPWRDSTNEERLDGKNGLLLTPTIDHLFDKGFISFEDKGDLIVSPVADRPSLLKMGIKPDAKVNVGVFSEGQRIFLEYHRENVLTMSRRSGALSNSANGSESQIEKQLGIRQARLHGETFRRPLWRSGTPNN